MKQNSNPTKRGAFSTRLGAIATAVGSAVGLGNIWRFPYEAGTHGGGAFLILYLFFILLIGIPLLCAEFSIGRDSRSNAADAFATLSSNKSWGMIGMLGIFTSILILSFYSVVAGWTVEYTYLSVARGFQSSDSSTLHSLFNSFLISPWKQLICTWLFLIINYFALVRGVQRGIEKLSNLLMPILFLILVVFCVNSIFLPGAAEGLKFLLTPDFSVITPKVVLSAMGQAFFSLSLGLGCMLTYGSYFKTSTNIPRTAFTIAGLDTLVAILAGIIIFPAVFSFGMSPQAGPTLVFEVLPSIFGALPGGAVLAFLFFILLFIASLTSTISLAEISISFCCEKFNWSRIKATTVIILIVFLLSGICALSFGPLSDFKIFAMTIFNLFDFSSSNILLPIGGFLTSIFAGWVYSSKQFGRQLTLPAESDSKMLPVMRFLLRYLIPIMLLIILFNTFF